jgi:hypothetical protein
VNLGILRRLARSLAFLAFLASIAFIAMVMLTVLGALLRRAGSERRRLAWIVVACRLTRLAPLFSPWASLSSCATSTLLRDIPFYRCTARPPS